MRVSANVVVGRFDGEDGCYVEVFGFGTGEVHVRLAGSFDRRGMSDVFVALEPSEAMDVAAHLHKMIEQRPGSTSYRVRNVGILTFVHGLSRFEVGYDNAGDPYREGALFSVFEGEDGRKHTHVFVTKDIQGLTNAFSIVADHEERAKVDIAARSSESEEESGPSP